MIIAQVYHQPHQWKIKIEERVKKTASNFILIPSKLGYDVVFLSDIIMVEAAGNYSKLYRNDGATYLISKTLKTVENQINHSGFCRVHQSYLVNLQCILRINRGRNIILEMTNGLEAFVSRSKRKIFRNRLMSL